MPNIFTEKGYRFFFFSNEGTEPIHVHVEHGEKHSKFWIDPIKLSENRRFNSKELKEIRILIFKNLKKIKEKWYEHFSK